MQRSAPAAAGFITESLRQEALTYLSHLPRLLSEQGTAAAGQTALSLGNYLAWTAGHLEPGPHVDQPHHETPATVYALAKQLQAVGRRLLHSEQLQTMEARLSKLESVWLRLGTDLGYHHDKDRIFEQSL